MSSFDCYSRTSNPIRHLRQFQNKMVVHAHDDLLFCRRPFQPQGCRLPLILLTLKELASEFDDVTDAFYSQFASRREFQRNINHLLTVRIKPGKSLKSYVNYYQSQITLVYNYNEEVVPAAFVSGLQVTHSFYKHLIKNDVTKRRDILGQAQKFMQTEETNWSVITRPLNKDLRVRSRSNSLPQEKSKPHLRCCP